MHELCAFCAFCRSRACDFLLLYQPIEKAMWQPIRALQSLARIGSAGNAVVPLQKLHDARRHTVLERERRIIARAQRLPPPLRKGNAERLIRLRPEQLEAKLGFLRELLGAVKDASLGYRNAVRR